MITMEIDFLEQDMLELSLSFFDLILGPRQIAVLPWSNIRNRNNFVSEFFDFHQPNDFFTHIYANYLSFNFLFEIPDPDNNRGGMRMLMLTASVPFALFKKRALLQYYGSIEELFRDWATDLQKTPNLSLLFQDGRYQPEREIQPLLLKLCAYMGELQFIINVMPETFSVPISSLAQNLAKF